MITGRHLQAAEAASCDGRVAGSLKVLAYGHAQRAQNLKRRVELFVEAERRVRAAPPPRAAAAKAAADEELLIDGAAVAGRPVSGTVRSGGVGGGPGLRVEVSDGRQVAVAPAVAARFGLGDGDAVTGGCFELTAPAAGNEGDGEGGPSVEPNLSAPRPRPSSLLADGAGHAARPVHGLVADTPGGLRLVLQVYGYVHGPPAGASVVPESTASSYSLKAGDYIRGLAGPDEAPADPNAPEGSKPPARKRFALRAVYHVEQGAR
eukprot:tig00021518_g22019.t1